VYVCVSGVLPYIKTNPFICILIVVYCHVIRLFVVMKKLLYKNAIDHVCM